MCALFESQTAPLVYHLHMKNTFCVLQSQPKTETSSSSGEKSRRKGIPQKAWNPADDPDTKIYTCTYCNKSFRHKFAFTRHCKLHYGDYCLYCIICKKGFMDKRCLNAHMSTQHGAPKEFKCTLCGREFVYKAMLRTHMAKEHNVFQYKSD